MVLTAGSKTNVLEAEKVKEGKKVWRGMYSRVTRKLSKGDRFCVNGRLLAGSRGTQDNLVCSLREKEMTGLTSFMYVGRYEGRRGEEEEM